MTTRLPSPEAFRTYSNYLHAWRLVLEREAVIPVRFEWDLRAQQQLTPAERAGITASLQRAWGNLRALHILNSGWMAVDVLAVHPPIAYYAVHNASRAMLMANGRTPAESHSGVLRQMGEDCVAEAFVSPWSAYCRGVPRDRVVSGLGDINWPQSNLQTVGLGNARGFVAWSLTTTRTDAIDLEVERRRGRRLRAPRGLRQQREQDLRATTIFDLFYRFRRVAHYGQAEDFMQFQTDNEAIEFGSDLFDVTDALCWTLERQIHEKVGTDTYVGWLEVYMGQQAIGPGEGPVGRRYNSLTVPF